MNALLEVIPARPSHILAGFVDIQKPFSGWLRESPLRKRQEAEPRAGRPFRRPREPLTSGPEVSGPGPAARPGLRPASPSQPGRPGASRPAAGTQPTAPPRPPQPPWPTGSAGAARGACSLPARRPPTCPPAPARSPPPRDPPRRQRPTRSAGTGEGIPAARSAEPPGWARRGAAGSPLSRAAAAGGAAEAAPIRARGGAGRDGPGPAGEVRGTPPPRRARHRAARARQRRRSADRLRARGRAGAAEERLGARSPPFGPVLFVGPWCLPRGSQLSAGPEISILSRILFRTSVLSSECSQALTHHTIVESQNALG